MGKRRTHQDFVKEVSILTNGEYEVIGQYTGVSKKVWIKHLSEECNNNEFEPRASHFLNGSRCPTCSRKQINSHKRYTQKEFEDKFNVHAKGEYSLLDIYKNYNTKIEIRHNQCGFIYKVSPSKFFSGRRCPKCSGLMKKSTTQFIKKVSDLTDNEYTVVGEYVNSKTKIELKHNICNNTWLVVPSNFLRGTRCVYCSGRKKKDTQSFKEEIFKLYREEYSVIGEYINSQTKIEFTHNVCGGRFSTIPNNLLRGSGCPHCFGTPRKTTSIFRKEVFSSTNGEYELMSEYIDAHTKTTIKHNICELVYNVTPHSFLKGSRCPKCNESKGEKKIRGFLENKGLKYQAQHRIADCKNKIALPFDFAVFNEKGDVSVLLEYDGIQHFEAVDFFGGENGFLYRKKNDQIKNNYCKENSIKLVRIPYWKKNNIERILNETLINK